MAEIEFIGDDNYVLINDEFKNMILANKGTITFPASPGAQYVGSITTYTYTSTSDIPPILAVNSSFPVCVQSMTIVNKVCEWIIVCGETGRGASAEVFVFHLPQVVPNANGMMQLWNKDGELVFDSNLKYNKVEKAIPFTLNGTATTSISVEPSKKYACVTCNPSGSFTVAPYPPITRPPVYGIIESSARGGAWRSSSSQISVSQFGYIVRTYGTTTPPSTVGYNQPDGVFLILDVTNM